MNDDGANDQEPNHNLQHLVLMGRVSSLMPVIHHFRQELACDVKVEDCTDPYWTEEANESRVLPMLDLRDEFVECKHHWQASQKEYQYAQGNQAIDWDDRVVNKFVPRAHGAFQKLAKGTTWCTEQTYQTT